MPSKDTKVVAIRIPKKEYYDWLALASINQQPISVYLKSCLDISKAPQMDKSFVRPAPVLANIRGYKLYPEFNQEEIIYFLDDDLYEGGFYIKSTIAHLISFRYTRLRNQESFQVKGYPENGGAQFYTNTNFEWKEFTNATPISIQHSDMYDIIRNNSGKINGFKIKIA